MVNPNTQTWSEKVGVNLYCFGLLNLWHKRCCVGAVLDEEPSRIHITPLVCWNLILMTLLEKISEMRLCTPGTLSSGRDHVPQLRLLNFNFRI